MPLHLAPLFPLPQAPPLPAPSFHQHPPVWPASVLAKHSRKRSGNYSVYVRGSHCTKFRDGTQSLAGLRWSCDKLCTILKFFIEVDAILKLCFFWHIEQYLEGSQLVKEKKDRKDFSAHQQHPELTKWLSIIHLSLPIKNHVFFGMTYLLWHIGPTSLS